MNSENYTELKKQFEAETDDLLNKICDTFHDELKLIADKYGIITVSIKTSGDFGIKCSSPDFTNQL